MPKITLPEDLAIDRTFDREQQFDERSRKFSAVAHFTHTKVRSYTWRCDAWNDQGAEGACVGFAWSHELAARPSVIPTTAADGFKIYKHAQKIDEWVGENYEGTSVLAGVKALKALYKNSKGEPLVESYRWAFGIEDVVRVLGYRGPLVLGINWYTGMFDTDENGFIHVDGWLAGGHAILAKGIKIVWEDKLKGPNFENVDMEKSYVTLRNSWGQSWGLNGDARINLHDLNRLLHEYGEACIPVVRHR
jgi:hypothetical protein